MTKYDDVKPKMSKARRAELARTKRQATADARKTGRANAEALNRSLENAGHLNRPCAAEPSPTSVSENVDELSRTIRAIRKLSDGKPATPKPKRAATRLGRTALSVVPKPERS